MLTTFLQQLSGFFDRRFAIAYWLPGFIGLSTVSGLIVLFFGLKTANDWWDNQGNTLQVLLAGAALLISLIFAYLLQALTVSILRLYEGLWPDWLKLLAYLGISRSRQAKKKLLKASDYKNPGPHVSPSSNRAAINSLYQFGANRKLYYGFPRNSKLLRPTWLGNVMVAAEEYPYQLYRISAVVWWPRLIPLLPEKLSAQVDAALTPLLALLNLCSIFTLLAVGGGAIFGILNKGWGVVATIFLLGLLLARICYLAAVRQAESYGELLRVAFDMHRHEILKQMHINVPDNLVDERILWEVLNNWIGYYIMPWESKSLLIQEKRPDDPFYYDSHKTSPPKPQQLELTIKGTPSLTLRQINSENLGSPIAGVTHDPTSPS